MANHCFVDSTFSGEGELFRVNGSSTVYGSIGVYPIQENKFGADCSLYGDGVSVETVEAHGDNMFESLLLGFSAEQCENCPQGVNGDNKCIVNRRLEEIAGHMDEHADDDGFLQKTYRGKSIGKFVPSEDEIRAILDDPETLRIAEAFLSETYG